MIYKISKYQFVQIYLGLVPVPVGCRLTHVNNECNLFFDRHKLFSIQNHNIGTDSIINEFYVGTYYINKNDDLVYYKNNRYYIDGVELLLIINDDDILEYNIFKLLLEHISGDINVFSVNQYYTWKNV